MGEIIKSPLNMSHPFFILEFSSLVRDALTIFQFRLALLVHQISRFTNPVSIDAPNYQLYLPDINLRISFTLFKFAQFHNLKPDIGFFCFGSFDHPQVEL